LPQKVLELSLIESGRNGHKVVHSSFGIVVVGLSVENSAAFGASVVASKPLASAHLSENVRVVQQYCTFFRIVDGRVSEDPCADGAGGGVSVDDRTSFDGVRG
jgi:hypothetical protein